MDYIRLSGGLPNWEAGQVSKTDGEVKCRWIQEFHVAPLIASFPILQ